jgi:hypothetical protein
MKRAKETDDLLKGSEQTNGMGLGEQCFSFPDCQSCQITKVEWLNATTPLLHKKQSCLARGPNVSILKRTWSGLSACELDFI